MLIMLEGRGGGGGGGIQPHDLCHLGAVRGFGINLLCYVCFNGRFAALLSLNVF